MAAASKALAVTESGDLDTSAVDVQGVIAMIRAGEKIHLIEVERDNQQISDEILDRLVASGSAEELFSSDETTPVEDILNVPFVLNAVKFRNEDAKFAKESTVGVYVLLFGTSVGGEMLTIATGSKDIVVKLILSLQYENAFPRWVKFTSDETSSGNTVYKLVATKEPKRTAEKLAADPEAF